MQNDATIRTIQASNLLAYFRVLVTDKTYHRRFQDRHDLKKEISIFIYLSVCPTRLKATFFYH